MVTKKVSQNERALAKLLRDYCGFGYAGEAQANFAARELARRGVLAIGAKTVPNICPVQGAWGLRAYLRGLARGKP